MGKIHSQGIVLYVDLNLFWAQRETKDAKLEGMLGCLDKGDESVQLTPLLSYNHNRLNADQVAYDLY